MAVCKSVNVNPMNYMSPLFTLQHILHVYDNSFGLVPHKSMWQEYEGDQWGFDPRRKRTAKGRPVSTRIPTEMDEDENERTSRKKCGIYLHLIITTMFFCCKQKLSFQCPCEEKLWTGPDLARLEYVFA